MVIDDKQKTVQKEAEALGWTTDFFSNPDTLALSLDKQSLDVLLAVWLYDDTGKLTSRAVATKVYDAAIRKGLWLLGKDGLAAMTAVAPDVNLRTEKSPRTVIMNNEKELIKFLFDKYKNKIKKERLKLLNELLTKKLFQDTLFAISYDENIFSSAELISKTEQQKFERFVESYRNKVKFIIGPPSVEQKMDVDKTKLVALLNDLYDLGIPYDRTVGNILEKLRLGYNAITAASFDAAKIRTRGKTYWTKNPQFYTAWNARRAEILRYFDDKIKEKDSTKLKIADLLDAYNATVAYLYSSQKVAEFYQLPIAINQKFPLFKYAFPVDKYYSEVLFDYMLPYSSPKYFLEP